MNRGSVYDCKIQADGVSQGHTTVVTRNEVEQKPQLIGRLRKRILPIQDGAENIRHEFRWNPIGMDVTKLTLEGTWHFPADWTDFQRPFTKDPDIISEAVIRESELRDGASYLFRLKAKNDKGEYTSNAVYFQTERVNLTYLAVLAAQPHWPNGAMHPRFKKERREYNLLIGGQTEKVVFKVKPAKHVTTINGEPFKWNKTSKRSSPYALAQPGETRIFEIQVKENTYYRVYITRTFTMHGLPSPNQEIVANMPYEYCDPARTVIYEYGNMWELYKERFTAGMVILVMLLVRGVERMSRVDITLVKKRVKPSDDSSELFSGSSGTYSLIMHTEEMQDTS